jgi:hypothetical protein
MHRLSAFPLLLLLLAVAVSTRTQSAEPPLATIKAAAERGDGRAQHQLAEAYRSRSDEANALIWYRKAAAQDVVPSQSKLGRILIGYAKSPTATPAVQAMHAEEATRWLLKAANQGDKPAQLDLGRQFESGKFLKQDYVEAYKWYAVAALNPSPLDSTALGAKWARDAIILKMTQAQIADGQKRVAAFTPRRITTDDLPEPSWLQQLRLSGLSGPPDQRLAIINGVTISKGETVTVKVEGRTVRIRCLEIRDKSVLVQIEGLNKSRELALPAAKP